MLRWARTTIFLFIINFLLRFIKNCTITCWSRDPKHVMEHLNSTACWTSAANEDLEEGLVSKFLIDIYWLRRVSRVIFDERESHLPINYLTLLAHTMDLVLHSCCAITLIFAEHFYEWVSQDERVCRGELLELCLEQQKENMWQKKLWKIWWSPQTPKKLWRWWCHTIVSSYMIQRLLVQVEGGCGNNLHKVQASDGRQFLVSMPRKFRRNVWIKRGMSERYYRHTFWFQVYFRWLCGSWRHCWRT